MVCLAERLKNLQRNGKWLSLIRYAITSPMPTSQEQTMMIPGRLYIIHSRALSKNGRFGMLALPTSATKPIVSGRVCASTATMRATRCKRPCSLRPMKKSWMPRMENGVTPKNMTRKVNSSLVGPSESLVVCGIIERLFLN